jgi:hypothetical protein
VVSESFFSSSAHNDLVNRIVAELRVVIRTTMISVRSEFSRALEGLIGEVANSAQSLIGTTGEGLSRI